MITLTAVIFPLVTIGCGIWIFGAMITYLGEIRRDIRDAKR
jgi:hypothetical protein